MYKFSKHLLFGRRPSLAYSVFLQEAMRLFQLTALFEDRPYKLNTTDHFLSTFSNATTSEQDLLCELYLHDMILPHDNRHNFIAITGDIQLRAFTSFLANQVRWKDFLRVAVQNDKDSALWIRPEPSPSW